MNPASLCPRNIVRAAALAGLAGLLGQAPAALAQGVLFTYQGRVRSGGSDFNGVGQFKFALVTSTNTSRRATATAIMGGVAPNQFVSSCAITDGGSGYTGNAGVIFSGGGGSGATAVANVSGGVVNGITVLTPGAGYASAPVVTIAAPPDNIFYTTYWSNDGTSVDGSEPGAAVSVAVSNGLFTVTLGDPALANMAALDAAIFARPDLELRIWFNDGVNGFAALNPAQRLTAAPYAIGVQGVIAASQLTGTLPATQLGGTYSGAVTFNNGSNTFSGGFSGDGTGLTNLSPTSLVLFSTNTSLTSWGWDQYGQRSAPTNAQNIVSVAAGQGHSLALKADGTVIAWGAGRTNDPGSLFDFGQAIVPEGLSNVIAISAGLAHSLALRANGTVVAWGAGLTNGGGSGSDYGQSLVPSNLTTAVAISAGVYHSLALKADGTVVAWGAGTTNAGSIPDTGQSIVPPGLSNVTAISAGDTFSAALRSDGTVVAWGGAGYGETNIPPGLSNVVAISAGAVHTLALKNDGTVVAWGAGLTNNPDDGVDYGQAIVPPGLSNVVAIAAGFISSAALKADGTVVAWGDNTYGESGVPAGLNNVLAIAAGSSAAHVFAIRKQSDAPVAWLNSDNTFNGNITVNGDATVSGEMQTTDLRLNDGNLWLRGDNNVKNGLGWYAAGKKNFTGSFYDNGPNGPVLFGEGGGALGSYGTNGAQVALVWDARQRVGIGTTFPNAPLDFGFNSANSKILFPGGYGIGSTNYQYRFHLGGSGGEFAFLDAPAGNQLLTVKYYGSVGIGTPAPNAKLDVRGQIALGSSGQYTALGTSESGMRLVRGQVRNDGVILVGSGFTVSHTGTGAYTVTFSPAFSGAPVVVATVQHGIAQMATVSSPSAGVVYIDTWDANGTASDQFFHFIAIGPQ